MKQILFIVVALTTAFSSWAQQQNQAFLTGDMLNKSGAQRMLTQRLAKSYVAMYIGLDVEKNKRDIDNNIALFENRLGELKRIKVNNRYQNRLKKVENLWTDYKALILSRPTKENLEQLLVENTVILESCDLIVYELELYASRFSKKDELYQMNESILHLENVAGRQRMLTERILFHFLAHQSIIGGLNANIKEELTKALQDYEKTLVLLMGATENTPEIDYRLTLLSNEWEAIAKACQEKVEDSNRIKNLLTLGNKLVTSMDEITSLYEELIDFRVASLLLNNAIDMANQQGILIQKIANAYIMNGITGDDKYKDKVQTYIDKFEYHIDELKLFAPMDEITASLDIVDGLWTNYRNLGFSAVSKDNAKKLLYANNELLRGCDNVVMLLEMYAKIYKKSISRFDSDMAHWVNQTGKQEMLTERILMYSSALAWGINSTNIADDLEKAGYDYIKNFNELSATLPIPDIKKRGDQLVEKWGTVKIYLENLDENKDKLVNWSKDLSKELRTLTTMYRDRIHKMVLEEAIDKANYQCMLSQKIATSGLAIGMELNTKHYQQQLEKDKLLFQRQLDELESFASTPELKNVLTGVSQLWSTYQITFSGKLDREKAPQLLEISQEMLTACEQVAHQIQKEAASERVVIVDKAAHLRTMTEQVLLFGLAERWRVGNYSNKNLQILNNFEQIVAKLETQPNNSPEINRTLGLIRQYHKRLKEGTQNIKDVDLYSILLSHNMLLLETEKLTQAYEHSIIF